MQCTKICTNAILSGIRENKRVIFTLNGCLLCLGQARSQALGALLLPPGSTAPAARPPQTAAGIGRRIAPQEGLVPETSPATVDFLFQDSFFIHDIYKLVVKIMGITISQGSSLEFFGVQKREFQLLSCRRIISGKASERHTKVGGGFGPPRIRQGAGLGSSPLFRVSWDFLSGGPRVFAGAGNPLRSESRKPRNKAPGPEAVPRQLPRRPPGRREW